MSWLDRYFNTGYKTVQISGVPYVGERVLNFIGAITAADNPTNQSTDLTITSAGYNLLEQAGTPFTQRTTINFVGATLSDDAPNNRTTVNLTGITFAGDLSGTSSTQTVVGLQGHALASTAPTDGQVIQWINGSSQYQPKSYAGDVTGSPSASVVAALQGFAVATTTPTSAQVLAWNAGTSKWTATTPASGFTAGGDLSGSSTTQTVIAIQGHAVLVTAPTDGQVFQWVNGSTQWQATSYGGDVTGKPSASTVAKIQGFAVATTTPTNGQALVWNSGASQYAPAAVAPSGSASGDLAGSYPSPTVIQVSGSGTTNDIGGAGATINVIPTETILGSGTTNPVRGDTSKAQTTDGTTYVTLATYQVPTSTTVDYAASILARYSSGTGGAAGDFYRADITFSGDREGSGLTIYPSSPTPQNARSAGSGSTATAQVTVSSSTWTLAVRGTANVTFNWGIIMQEQRVT